MSKVTLRPTTASDLPHVFGEPLPFRIRAITALIGGRVIGVGGFAFPPHGPAIAFVQLAPTTDIEADGTKDVAEARHYPIAFHRAGLMAMEMIFASDAQEVIATADVDSDAAVRWLKRLGFKPSDSHGIAGKSLFVWERNKTSEAVGSADRRNRVNRARSDTASCGADHCQLPSKPLGPHGPPQ